MTNIKPYTYLIKFKPTGQCYYGSRVKNVKLNRTPEEDLMIYYQTSSKYIRSLIKEHGLDAFEWEIRKVFDSIDQAAKWENKVLARCRVLENTDKWLNRNIAGYIVPSKESRQKISEYHKGRPKSDEQREKIRSSNLGKNKGKRRTVEQKQLMSARVSGTKNPMFGPCSEERKRRIGEGNKGKKRSDSVKEAMAERMRANNPGRNKSEETRRKMSIALSGKKRQPRSEETKKRISNALKGIKRGPMSEESKIRKSIASKGKAKSKESSLKKAETARKMVENGNHPSLTKIVCPHCGTSVNKILFPRWHGDNCKLK